VRDVYRYGTEVNSHDLMKVLAIATMVVDHVGVHFTDENVWLRVVGRMAAPLFFFLVGYSGSYRFKPKLLYYWLVLVVVIYVTRAGESTVDRILPLNILLSFALIKLLLNRFDATRLTSEGLIIVLSTMMVFSLPTYLLIEYGTLGLCYAIGARLLSKRRKFAKLWISATVGVHFVFELTFLLILNEKVSTQLLPFAIPLLALVFAVNLIIFLNYNFRAFKIGPKYLRTLLIYVSRYSLEVYVFHLSAFMIVHYVWHPTILLW